MGTQLKRIYDTPSDDDGYRVLVDRLWPRGIRKADAKIDEWLKEIAPSDELRRDFHGHPERYAEFKEAYAAELEAHARTLDELRARIEQGPLTLLYAAKDTEHNNARVLGEILGRTER
jgi:uncharacterized protein YeaO (DUF488 family)